MRRVDCFISIATLVLWFVYITMGENWIVGAAVGAGVGWTTTRLFFKSFDEKLNQ